MKKMCMQVLAGLLLTMSISSMYGVRVARIKPQLLKKQLVTVQNAPHQEIQGYFHFKNEAPYPVQLRLVSRHPGIEHTKDYILKAAGSKDMNGSAIDAVRIKKSDVYPVTAFILVRGPIDTDFTKNVVVAANDWMSSDSSNSGTDWALYDYFVVYGSKDHDGQLAVHMAKDGFQYPEPNSMILQIPDHVAMKNLTPSHQNTASMAHLQSPDAVAMSKSHAANSTNMSKLQSPQSVSMSKTQAPGNSVKMSNLQDSDGDSTSMAHLQSPDAVAMSKSHAANSTNMSKLQSPQSVSMSKTQASGNNVKMSNLQDSDGDSTSMAHLQSPHAVKMSKAQRKRLSKMRKLKQPQAVQAQTVTSNNPTALQQKLSM